MDTTIERIERIPVDVPFREVPARNMAREIPHWTYFEIVEVELASGAVGHGETMLFYSWGETTDEDVERARGANAAQLMWDDSLGPGLQIALFDAVGRALEVPAYELLGGKAHDRTPISWWCIEMPPEDLVSEAERARERGYTNLKFKGRPWFDVFEQLDALEAALPADFAVDVDFNETLLDAERGLPILERIEAEYPQVSHIEGPIPQADFDGNRRLVEELDLPVVLHYGDPEAKPMVCEGACDGFVASGGASTLRDIAAVTEMSGQPFWIQLTGTGIAAAWSVQCGGAFEKAEWPAIPCHQLYEHDLLADSIDVEDGYATVPDEPGLGVEIDRDALEEYRTEKPPERPNPPRLIEIDWPDGPTIYVAEAEVNYLIKHAMDEQFPYFEPGATTRVLHDDGTDAWADLHAQAKAEGPIEFGEPRL